MAGFINGAVFPVHISRGSPGGPDWPAEIVELASGFEERNTPWASPLRRYDARFGVRTPAELYEVLSLYKVAFGRLRGFRFLDWTDYRSGAPHLTGTRPGAGNGRRRDHAIPAIETLCLRRRELRPQDHTAIRNDPDRRRRRAHRIRLEPRCDHRAGQFRCGPGGGCGTLLGRAVPCAGTL